MRHQEIVKGILWDLDGVIADTQTYHLEALRQAMTAYGFQASEEIVQRMFGTTTLKILAAILEDHNDPALLEEMKDAHSRFFCESIAGHVEIFPGVEDCLKMFAGKGLRQAIASSSTMEIIDGIVDELGLRVYFQAIVSGADLPPKPDPAVFRKAAGALGLSPQECVVIEDSPMGIESAHAAGARCIAVGTSRPLEALSAAEVRVGRLDELIVDVLDRI